MYNTITMHESKLFATVYDQMPDNFSGNQFCEKLKEYGYTQIYLNHHVKYLMDKCTRLSKRMWIKNKQLDKTLFIYETPTDKLELTVEICVEFLKKKGAKIMMPVTEYKEI